MARKHRSQKSRRVHHRQRGGYPAPDPSAYSSAATYQLAVNGDSSSQYNRVFDVNGPDGRIPGNQIVGLQGQNLGYPPSVSMKGGALANAPVSNVPVSNVPVSNVPVSNVPVSNVNLHSQMKGSLKGGKRGSRKGGFYLGPIVNQAAVPLSLLGMQQTYNRKKKGGFLGPIINQAAVPFSLLGMQQTYKRGKKGGKKTRKHYKH